MSYTKGLRVRENCPRVIETGEGVLAAVFHWAGVSPEAGTDDERRAAACANARLFVAAGALYEVAEMAAQASFPRGHRSRMYAAARAAIALAKGEKP